MHALFTIESTQKLWADLATRLGAIPDPLVQILDAEGNAEEGDGGDDVVAPARGAVDARPPGHAEPAGRLLLEQPVDVPVQGVHSGRSSATNSGLRGKTIRCERGMEQE